MHSTTLEAFCFFTRAIFEVVFCLSEETFWLLHEEAFIFMAKVPSKSMFGSLEIIF